MGFKPMALMGAAAIGILTFAVMADDTFDKMIQAGKFNEAAKYAEDNIPVASRDASVWAKLGIAYEKQNLNEKALACYMVSLRSKKNYDAYLGAARIYNNLKQPETALDMAKKAMEIKASGEASWEYARASIALGKPAEAKTALERVVETDPSNVVANRELGLLYYKAGDSKKAVSLLKVAIRGGGGGEIAVMIATAYRSMGQPDSVIAYLTIASKDPTSRGEVALELARLYFQQEQFRPAVENYEKADQSKLSAIDLYQYALCSEKSGADEDAYMRLYGEAATKFGASTSKVALEVYEKCGRWYLKKKNYTKAFAHLQSVYTADPQGKVVADIGFLMADAVSGMGKREQAVSYLQSTVSRDPQNVEAYARLSEIYQAMGKTEMAHATLEKLVGLNPNDPKIQLALGQYSLKARKYADALRYFKKCFTLEPSAEAAEGMTQAAWEMKKYDVARDAAESALHYDSTLASPQRILARIYLTEKNFTGARQLLEKIVKKNPGDIDTWRDLALCYEKTDNHSLLTEADKTIMSLDKKDVVSRLRYARNAMSANNLREALAVLKELLVLSPKDPEIVKSLADCSIKLKNSDDAVLYLRKFVELRPGDAAAQRDLGNLLYDKKEYAGALDAYRAAFKADAGIKGFFKRYAELLIKLKGPEKEAAAVFSAAVRAGEGSDEIYSSLGAIYHKQGAFAQAIEMYQRALQINPQNFEVLSSLASCQAKAGKAADAIVSYEQATALRPGDPEEQKALGDLYMQTGKKSQAVNVYKRYLDKGQADPAIAVLVGEYEYDQKNYKNAVTYFGKASGKEAEKAEYLHQYGAAAYQVGDLRKTEELYKRLVVLNPKNADAYKTLYEIAKKNNELASSADYLKKYTTLAPTDLGMLIALGDLLYSLKDLPGALAAYRGALRVDPKAKGFYERYVSLVGAQAPGDLIQAMKGAIDAGEANVIMYSQLGEIYRKAGNYPKAIQMFEKASQLDPKSGSHLMSLAECQEKGGTIDMAAATYEQAIAMNPMADREYKALGALYMRLKKTEPAVRAYKKYLEKNQDNGIAIIVGEQALGQKNYTEAVKYFGMVSGAEARSPQFLSRYANACHEARDDAKALSLYKQLAVMTPKDADVYSKLYELTLRSGTKEEAILYLKKYAAFKPRDAMTLRTLGDLHYDQKDRAGALASYRTLAKVDTAAKGYFRRYAELVMAEGNESEIVAVLLAAIAANEADGKMYTRLGDSYRKQAQYAKAAAMYEKASQSDPKNATLLASLAECQIKSNNAGAAAATYEQAIVMNPNASREYKALGDLYLQQKKTDQAMRAYKKYLERTSDDEIAKLIGEQALETKNYTDAMIYFSMVKGKDANSPSFLLMFGKACYKGREEAKALVIYKRLAVLLSDNAEVFGTLYDIQNRAGQKDEALSYLKRYAALKPSDARAQRELGDILYEQKDRAGALTAYRAALKADSTATGFYARYASLITASSDQAEKIKVLSGAIAAKEADGKMFRTLADIYREQGTCAKAIPLYQRAIQIDPRDPTLFSSLADCQLKSGSTKEAMVTYEQAAAMNPNASTEHKALGELYLQQKKTDLAVKAYKKYLEKNAGDATVAKFVGEQEYKAKNYAEAKKYLGMVTGPEAKSSHFLVIYGKAAYSAKDYPTAQKVYKQLALLTPTDPEVFKTLYEISARVAQPAEVATYLKRYVKLSPNDAEAQKFLGDLLYDQKDMPGALNAYRIALKVDPTMKGIHKRYVELVLKIGNAQERLAALNGAIAAGEADAQMYASMGDLYRTAGNCQKAIQMYGKAMDADPKNTQLLFNQADCQRATGKVREATLSYEQALAMNPGMVAEYKTLGELYEQQKKMDAATASYKKYLEKNPTDSKIAILVGHASFTQKNYADADKYYTLVKDDNSPGYLAEYGLSAFRQKNDNSAILAIERLRSTRGGDLGIRAEAYKALADIYEKKGDSKKAAEVLNSYLGLPGVKDQDAAHRRAEVLDGTDAASAALLYENNIKLYPNDYRNYFKAGSYYAKQKATARKGVLYLERCAALADTIAQVWLELGRFYATVNRDKNMLDAFRKYIQLDQQNIDAISAIGEMLLSKQMIDDAMMFLEMANSLRENDVKVMTHLARGYIMTKRRSESAKIIEKILRVSEGNIDDDLRLTLIDVYLETGKTKEAISELNTVLGKKRNNVLLLKYAKALLATGMYPEAASAIEDIKATEPDNLEAIMTLGRIQTSQRKYNEAIETYKEALYINQYYAPAMVERANVYSIQNKTQWAKTFYERAIKADPKSALAYLGLARIAKSDKDMETYQQQMKKARALDPEDPEIAAELKSMRN